MPKNAPKLPPLAPGLAEIWMQRTLEVARTALEHEEVPVGCVLYGADGREVAAAHDRRQGGADPLAHAEWLVLREAARLQGDWRLDGMSMVVTLEPCPMCAGAILMARVGRVIYGAPSPKWGAAGSRADWLASGAFPHRPELIGGVMAEPCGRLLSEYFRNLRHRDPEQARQGW